MVFGTAAGQLTEPPPRPAEPGPELALALAPTPGPEPVDNCLWIAAVSSGLAAAALGSALEAAIVLLEASPFRG